MWLNSVAAEFTFRHAEAALRAGCRHRGLLPTLNDSHGAAVGACFVDEERVDPQQGDFYGGWITSHVAGPFKGGPGTKQW